MWMGNKVVKITMDENWVMLSMTQDHPASNGELQQKEIWKAHKSLEKRGELVPYYSKK